MGWDGIHCWYWCCHRSKVCSKAHRLPSAALPPLWSAGLFQKANSPTVTCVQTSSHRPERPTILQYSDFQKVVARVLKSTEGGSCSSPQKEEVARVHRRRKLIESTEGGSRSNPQKEEAAQVHRRRKLLEYTEEGSSQTMMPGLLGKYSEFGCHESIIASGCLM